MDLPTRRHALAALSSLGIGSATFHRALAQQVAVGPIDLDMIAEAEWVAGIQLSEEQREMAAEALSSAQSSLGPLRQQDLPHSLYPATTFRPLERPQQPNHKVRTEVRFSESATLSVPADDETLAFLPVSEQAALIRRGELRSIDLTELYLKRLEKYDPLLKCVVTLTPDLARAQAAKADQELQAGHYRGPLHGIPWGVKDLFSVPGYPTTWGAPQYREQRLPDTASVVRRLEAAGAVLVGKLTTGHYALGDQWFGGRTRNPWNPHQGSSGSSAGSASATAAGLVSFAIGTETIGSITSPAKRCGVTGLRPTFGRVSRGGCMPLSWSLDKVGPLCRTVEDAAVVLGSIHGADEHDPCAVNRDYQWPQGIKNGLRIGYEAAEMERHQQDLDVLQSLGMQLVPIEFPRDDAYAALRYVLTAESAAIFERLTRQQEPKGVKYWPTTWATGQFVSAIDYLRAQRVRRRLMREMHELFERVDVLVGVQRLLELNMTGHPQLAIPNGFRRTGEFDQPTSLFLTGDIYRESTLLAVAAAYQQATTVHLRRPPLDAYLSRREEFHAAADQLDEQRLYP